MKTYKGLTRTEKNPEQLMDRMEIDDTLLYMDGNLITQGTVSPQKHPDRTNRYIK